MTDNKKTDSPSQYCSDIDQPFTYRGYAVTLKQDCDTCNPWTDWDCMTPMLWFSYERYHETLNECDGENALKYFFGHVEPDWVYENRTALLGIMPPWESVESSLADCLADSTDSDSLAGFDREDDSACLAWSKAYLDGSKRVEYLDFFLHDILTDHLDELRNDGLSDFFDTLEKLYTLLGWNCLSTSRDGYCQGDSVYVLLVDTPEHLKACGLVPDTRQPERLEDGLEREADLFGAWAFGDCYYYLIEDSDGGDADSCGGFIEPNLWHSDSAGIWGAIGDSVAGLIDRERKQKLAATKRYIQNKVPLAKRHAA